MANNELIAPVNNTLNQSTVGSTKVGGDLGKDAFLQLLVTQMKYQDPFNPLSDTDYLAQLAQFSSLEQMENLNTQFNQYNGQSMIGKYGTAIYTDPVTSKQSALEGVVEAISIKNGTTYAVIDSKEVPLKSVKVLQESISNEDIAKIQQLQAGNAFALVGKYVEGDIAVLDDDGKPVKDEQGKPKVEKVKGTVDQVVMNNGDFKLMIGKKEIKLSNVLKVYNEAPPAEEDEEDN